MFIAKVKNNGRDYLHLMEYYSELNENGKCMRKQRTVKCIGFLDKVSDGKKDFLERLRISFKNKDPILDSLKEFLDKNTTREKLQFEFSVEDKVSATLNPKNIGYFILEKVFNDFNLSQMLRQEKSRRKIDYDLLGLTKLLIYGRVLTPSSKCKTFYQNDNYLFPPLKENENERNLIHIYRALDVLSKKSVSIQNKIDKSIKKNIGRSTEICFYDVTNYSFEIEQNDENVSLENGEVISEGLRKSGPSKRKTRDPIVQMGLFTDSNNIPISYKIFPGNHIDITTLRPAMKESLEKMGYKKVLIVADGGLNSGKNKAKITNDGNDYIFSKSTKKSDKVAKKWILNEDGYEWNKKRNFKVKSKIVDVKIIDENGKEKIIKEKIVCYWSKKFYDYEVNKNKKFREYLEKVYEFPDKLKNKQPKINKYISKQFIDKKTGEVLKPKTNYFLDNKKLEEDVKLLGYYTLTTSKIELSEEEIIEKYKGLSKIENSFRTIKTYLNANPVFVRTKEHINAHFLICFIALTMIRVIQFKVLKNEKKKTDKFTNWEEGLSAEKIIGALNSFMADEIKNGYYKISNISNDLEQIFSSFDIRKLPNFPTVQDLIKCKKQNM
jgi:transposase